MFEYYLRIKRVQRYEDFLNFANSFEKKYYLCTNKTRFI